MSTINQTQEDLLIYGQHSDDMYVSSYMQPNKTNLKEVTQLANDVTQIAYMSNSFRDLVNFQGELVDNIEHNITVSHGRVLVGTQDLKKAETYSKNKCILIVIAFMLLIVVGLSIALGFKFN